MSTIAPMGRAGSIAATAPAAASTRASRTAPAAPRVEVWKATPTSEQRLSASTLRRTTDPTVRAALDNARKVDAFFRTTFQRNGWDGKGAPLSVVVHTPDENGKPLNNAYWDNDRRKIYLGDGDGNVFAPLGNSLDVLTHETVHAIVDSEVRLRYSGQQGGINESFADVLGALADPDRDWHIGEDVFTPGRPGDSIRDLRAPRFQHTRALPKGAEIDVHELSGIPTLAAVKVADAIGRDDMGQIWYRALTDHLTPQSGYAGAARATLRAATELFGHDSRQFSAVRDAWKAVGVQARYRPQAATNDAAKGARQDLVSTTHKA